MFKLQRFTQCNKLISFVLLILIALNSLLFYLFDLQVKQQLNDVADLLSANPYAETIPTSKLKVLHEQGFALTQGGVHTVQYSVPAGEQAVQLYHVGIWPAKANTVLFFNLLFLGLVVFVLRWWAIYKSPAKESHAVATLPLSKTQLGKGQRIEHNVGIFALVKWSCTIPQDVDAQVHFHIHVSKAFANECTSSIRYLASGAVAVTLKGVSCTKADVIARTVHEVVFQALVSFRQDLSRSSVKAGVCIYNEAGEQTQVYQSARSALGIATNQMWRHIHIVRLNKSLSSTLKNDGTDFISLIEKRQFNLFYQPLFDFNLEDVILSEALLRVRHKELGVMCAKQFMQHLHLESDLILLDKTIVSHTLHSLAHEQTHSRVSINLHAYSWINRDFQLWLHDALETSGRARDIVLEISVDDFYRHTERLNSVFVNLQEIGCSVFVDNVSHALNINVIKGVSGIKGLKLSYDLVHEIHASAQRRKVVKLLVNQAHKLALPVYAVGVETHAELQCIKELGIKGAQGHYFSAPLERLELTH